MTTHDILVKARSARSALLTAGTELKNAALLAMADSLWDTRSTILEANAQDMEAAQSHISGVMLDRLALSEARIADMAQGIRQVAGLPDPVG